MKPPFPLAIAAGLALLAAACATQPVSPLPTVASVDLERYAGTWHEIALMPNRFQSMCAAETTANYRLEDGEVRVTNRCRKANGDIEEATGVAEVVPGSNNAKLRVSFFRPFYGDYWILALDPGYRWVLVGEPGRRYAWVLAREPAMPAADLEAVLDRAAALGFDRGAFRRSPQPGRG